MGNHISKFKNFEQNIYSHSSHNLNSNKECAFKFQQTSNYSILLQDSREREKEEDIIPSAVNDHILFYNVMHVNYMTYKDTMFIETQTCLKNYK